MEKLDITELPTNTQGYRLKTVNFIKQIVADFYGQPMTIYEIKSQKNDVVQVKHSAMYFVMKNLEKINKSETATWFGWKHSNVIATEKKFDRLLSWDRVLQKEFAEIQNIITYKTFAASSRLNLEKNYYFVDLNNLISVKQSSGKAIIFSGYSEKELENLIILDKSKMTNESEILINQIPGAKENLVIGDKTMWKKHLETGMYLMEKNPPTNTNNDEKV